MSKLFKILRLLDKDNVLSLTNFALLASIIKVTCTRTPSFVDWLVIATTLVSYQFKRYIESKTTKTEAFEARIKELEHAVITLKNIITLKR
jgi:hypothetical protein